LDKLEQDGYLINLGQMKDNNKVIGIWKLQFVLLMQKLPSCAQNVKQD